MARGPIPGECTVPHPLYGLYERRLLSSLPRERMPRHVGVILDGNRRWARSIGLDPTTGHQRGADKIHDLLDWCEEAGVEVVTLWLFSTDNLNRPPAELEDLLRIIEGAVRSLADTGRWRIRTVGALDLMPGDFSRNLKEITAETTDNPGLVVNAAICYGGRREIADAVRSLLSEHAGLGTSIDFRSALRTDTTATGTRLRIGSYQSIELNTGTAVPEWGGKKVFVMMEDCAYLTADGYRLFRPRQEAFYLIPSRR